MSSTASRPLSGVLPFSRQPSHHYFPHHVHGCRLAGPELELGDGLADEHIHAAGGDAAGGLGLAQEAREGGIEPQ